MRSRRVSIGTLLVAGAVCGMPATGEAQCCLSGLFSGTGCGCFKKAPPAYAVAPVPAPPPVAAVATPAVPPPPAQPVMVPVQQVSYVPETTYQTQYKCVPVTCYRPSCEIDPCTGCAVECVELVTNYVQQPVSVPVTQYRAVYTTKYVQMQPGANPQAYAGAVVAQPNVAGAAASPFAAPQTTPQAWGAAGTAAPAVPPQQPMLPPAAGGSTYQQQIVPQSGAYVPPQTPAQPQPTSPPSLAPAPSLKPIPELSRQPGQPLVGQPLANGNGGQTSAVPDQSDRGSDGTTARQQPAPAVTPPPSLRPIPPASSGPTSSSRSSYGTPLRGDSGMPVLPGNGPSSSTRAFPKLLEPTGHTTSWRPTRASAPALGEPAGGLSSQPVTQSRATWQPAFTQAPAGPYAQGWQPSYPTAALPTRAQ